jgi:hypothetical protein
VQRGPLAPDLDQALARGDLLVGRDRVLEIAKQDVGLARHVGHLRHHLRIAGVEKVDAARRLERHLVQRLGSAQRQRFEEITGTAHANTSRATAPPMTDARSAAAALDLELRAPTLG